MNIEIFNDWLPALSSTALLSVALWLLRKVIATRLFHEVKYEFDNKIENIKSELRKKEEELNAELKSKSSQIESIRNSVLNAMSTRQEYMFKCQVKAINNVWKAVLFLGQVKTFVSALSILDLDKVREKTSYAEVQEIFKVLDIVDLDAAELNLATRSRPFLSPPVWAFFSAYHAIMISGVVAVKLIAKGGDGKNILESEKVKELVLAALPDSYELVNKYGYRVYGKLLDDLEEEILSSLQSMFNGENVDKETLERSIIIAKKSEELHALKA